MKIQPAVIIRGGSRGIVTTFLLIMAMKFGERHPPRESGIVVLKIDVAHMKVLPPENNSTFTVRDCEARTQFVFPRETMLYEIRLKARPGPQTPESVYTNIENAMPL